MGEKKNAHKTLVGNPERKKTVGIQRRRRENNIKALADIKEN
jgi:hypothetical protein